MQFAKLQFGASEEQLLLDDVVDDEAVVLEALDVDETEEDVADEEEVLLVLGTNTSTNIPATTARIATTVVAITARGYIS